MSQTIISWSEAIRSRSYAIQFTFCIVAILLVVSFLPYYFHSVIGPKPGIQLDDPVLNLFPPQDHSWIIFGLIYLSLLITIHGTGAKPLSVLLGLKSYLVITLLRMITMYAFTLEPPAEMIPLNDPIVDIIAYGGVVFNKDLFFSGHVATLTLFTLLEERPLLKKFLIFSLVVVAGLILLQRVHYTIDVLVAPFIAYATVKFVKYLFK